MAKEPRRVRHPAGFRPIFLSGDLRRRTTMFSRAAPKTRRVHTRSGAPRDTMRASPEIVNLERTGLTRPSGRGDDAASNPRRHHRRASTSVGTCAHVVTGRARDSRGGAEDIVAAVGRSIFALRAGNCLAPAAGGPPDGPRPAARPSILN